MGRQTRDIGAFHSMISGDVWQGEGSWDAKSIDSK